MIDLQFAYTRIDKGPKKAPKKRTKKKRKRDEDEFHIRQQRLAIYSSTFSRLLASLYSSSSSVIAGSWKLSKGIARKCGVAKWWKGNEEKRSRRTFASVAVAFLTRRKKSPEDNIANHSTRRHAYYNIRLCLCFPGFIVYCINVCILYNNKLGALVCDVAEEYKHRLLGVGTFICRVFSTELSFLPSVPQVYVFRGEIAARAFPPYPPHIFYRVPSVKLAKRDFVLRAVWFLFASVRNILSASRRETSSRAIFPLAIPTQPSPFTHPVTPSRYSDEETEGWDPSTGFLTRPSLTCLFTYVASLSFGWPAKLGM